MKLIDEKKFLAEFSVMAYSRGYIARILSKHLKDLPKKKVKRINHEDMPRTWGAKEGYNQCLEDCEET